MSSRSVPEGWAALLVEAGFYDRRNGQASMSALSEATGIHASTISAMMYGDRKTRTDRVDRIATAISTATHRDPDEIHQMVHEWVGAALGAPGKFEAHEDADLLDQKERDAVNELIRLFAVSKRALASRGTEATVTVDDEAREIARRKTPQRGRTTKVRPDVEGSTADEA